MHPTAQKVADAARDLGLKVQIKEFEATTRSAQDAANAIGCQVTQIVKSLLFVGITKYVLDYTARGVNQLTIEKMRTDSFRDT